MGNLRNSAIYPLRELVDPFEQAVVRKTDRFQRLVTSEMHGQPLRQAAAYMKAALRMGLPLPRIY
jgi:hypothetical protein